MSTEYEIDGVTGDLIRYGVRYVKAIRWTAPLLPGFPALAFCDLIVHGRLGAFRAEYFRPRDPDTRQPRSGRWEVTPIASAHDETPDGPMLTVPVRWGREHWLDLLLVADGEDVVRDRLTGIHRVLHQHPSPAAHRAHQLGHQDAESEPTVADPQGLAAWLVAAGYAGVRADQAWAAYASGRHDGMRDISRKTPEEENR